MTPQSLDPPDTATQPSKPVMCFARGDGQIIEANSATSELLGYSPDELLRLNLADILIANPDAPHRWQDLKPGDFYAEQGALRHKDGRSSPDEQHLMRLADGRVLLFARPDLIYWSLGQGLMLGEESWRFVLNQIPAVVWTTDRDLRITSGLGAGLTSMYETAGITFGDMAGLPLEELFQVNDPSFPPLQAHRRAIQGESVRYETQWAGISFDSHVEPLRDSERRIVGAIGIAYDITLRKTAQDDLRRLTLELESRVAERTRELVQRNAELQSEIAERQKTTEALRKEQRLLLQILELHERDRRLMAYELHDGLVQDITGALMHLEAVKAAALNDPHWQTNFQFSLDLLRSSLVEARGLISGLRPPILDEHGIVAAIQFLASEHRTATGADTILHADVDFERVASPLETAIFRIAQEALNNVRRHAQAETVELELLQVGNKVRLTITDSGVGFDPQTIKEHTYGLQGIRERSRLLGGSATITSAPGKGTRIEVTLPLIRASEHGSQGIHLPPVPPVERPSTKTTLEHSTSPGEQ